jgi:hypothetical protein
MVGECHIAASVSVIYSIARGKNVSITLVF